MLVRSAAPARLMVGAAEFADKKILKTRFDI